MRALWLHGRLFRELSLQGPFLLIRCEIFCETPPVKHYRHSHCCALKDRRFCFGALFYFLPVFTPLFSGCLCEIVLRLRLKIRFWQKLQR